MKAHNNFLYSSYGINGGTILILLVLLLTTAIGQQKIELWHNNIKFIFCDSVICWIFNKESAGCSREADMKKRDLSGKCDIL